MKELKQTIIEIFIVKTACAIYSNPSSNWIPKDNPEKTIEFPWMVFYLKYSIKSISFHHISLILVSLEGCVGLLDRRLRNHLFLFRNNYLRVFHIDSSTLCDSRTFTHHSSTWKSKINQFSMKNENSLDSSALIRFL